MYYADWGSEIDMDTDGVNIIVLCSYWILYSQLLF